MRRRESDGSAPSADVDHGRFWPARRSIESTGEKLFGRRTWNEHASGHAKRDATETHAKKPSGALERDSGDRYPGLIANLPLLIFGEL